MALRSRKTLFAFLGFGACASVGALVLGQGTASSRVIEPTAVVNRSVVAPGILEGARPSVELRFVAAGEVAEVLVDEGATVTAGQPLARLGAKRATAQVAQAQAELEAARARLALLSRGPLRNEIKIAEAEAAAQRRRFSQTELVLSVKSKLRAHSAVPQTELDEAQAERDIADAEANALGSKLALLRSGARSELRAEAAAKVKVAEAELQYKQALLEETELRAPMNGVILRRLVEPGARAALDAPTPAFTMTDRSRLILRAEVDEADWGGVRIGQRGYAIPTAGGRVTGFVARLASEFGIKRVGTEDPRAPRDTRAIEILFELDSARDLPIGLRMDVHLESPH